MLKFYVDPPTNQNLTKSKSTVGRYLEASTHISAWNGKSTTPLNLRRKNQRGPRTHSGNLVALSKSVKMTFTNLDHRQIDFIKDLHGKAPNLNSAQIIVQTRSFFGAYPSGQVTKWLYHSMGDFAPAREQVLRKQGDPLSSKRSAGRDSGNSTIADVTEAGRRNENGGKKAPATVQRAKLLIPQVQERPLRTGR
jgi:hypothetical protein